MTTFTPREIAILRILATTGESDRDIANKLGLSRDRIVKALHEIRHKVGVETRLELAVWAWLHGYGQHPESQRRKAA